MAFPADQVNSKILYCLINRFIHFHNSTDGLADDFFTLNIRLNNTIKFLNVFIAGANKCFFNQSIDPCN